MVKYDDSGEQAGSLYSENWPMGGFRQTERPMKVFASIAATALIGLCAHGLTGMPLHWWGDAGAFTVIATLMWLFMED
jgi:hypothetical protein